MSPSIGAITVAAVTLVLATARLVMWSKQSAGASEGGLSWLVLLAIAAGFGVTIWFATRSNGGGLVVLAIVLASIALLLGLILLAGKFVV